MALLFSLMVTPGFIDVHTHYDGQLTWSSRVSPSSSHGVTTVVTGNCGVGFAPCKPEDRKRLIQLLEGVEDIPEIVTTEGLEWDWESFPEFIAALRRRRHDIDYAVQLPHSALRVFVMGERAVDREASRPDEREQMKALARDAIAAGAIGFGTSRSVFHRSPDGQIIPTAHAEEEELIAIAEGIRDAGGGVMQVILDIHEPVKDLAVFRQIASNAGLALSYSLFQGKFDPENWRELLRQTELANYEYQSLDPIRDMMVHPFAIPALGDGGAHYGMICDSTYSTFMLAHWGRDRASGRIPLPAIVSALTARPAAMLGLADRGRLAEGLRANINVIDLERLVLHKPEVVHDLPAGGRRITQDADGYVATIVGGEIIMRNGSPTGALPGVMVERTAAPATMMAAAE